MIHPIDPKRDLSRKFPLLGKYLSVKQINLFSSFLPPLYISEISGIRSRATGKDIEGWFVACPYTPARMLELPEKAVYHRIIQTGRLAEKLGARLLGLGAFTSVVGDAGLTISRSLSIPVTTGDSYTVAVAIGAVWEAARVMEIPLAEATAAVVGATGAIGSVAAELIARHVAQVVLVGRPLSAARFAAIGERIRARPLTRAQVSQATDLAALAQADLILSVTGAIDVVIEPENLRPGAVVCDIARPHDVSARVAAMRDGVLAIDCGMVAVPGEVDVHFDFGSPPRMVYACMAEATALALDGRVESHTLGKQITVEQVEEIACLASKHGLKLGGFRSFERAVTPDQIERARAASAKTRAWRAREVIA